MSESSKDGLRHLGRSSRQPVDEVDLIPWEGGRISVRLDCSEFTSLCPVTRQPDFATLVVEYVPDKHLVETKSMKLYLWRYRDRAVFNETLIDAIADDLWEQLAPLWLRITGSFNPRGGIAITARTERGNLEDDS